MMTGIFTLMALNWISPLQPLPPIPAPRQIAWQDMETNAFVHFGPNTFTDVEWGGGKEDPDLFDPADLNCDQWAETLKEAGFKGVVITAKHHDGFCLWPSKLSSHTVAQSRWRGGKGDVLRELSGACRRHGLKMGVYLSPWDRNHPSYGTPDYNNVFAGMLREVLSHYGPIFEVWFDGANGEGPNGKKQVYDWPLFVSVVRKYQPNAVIFSDAGPDVRWVGNESGEAGETCWSTIPGDRYVPGTPYYSELTHGREDGDRWAAPECDVSIRPGWFYHSAEDSKTKTPEQLLDLYEKSVGRNSLLLLNVPPDRRGRLAEPDVDSLLGFRRLLNDVYGRNLASDARMEGASRDMFDGRQDRYWTADTGDSFVAVFPKGVRFDRILLGEPISLGQRVRAFRVEAKPEGGEWSVVAEGTTLGRKRILPIRPTEASAVRVTIVSSRARAALNRFGLFRRL